MDKYLRRGIMTHFNAVPGGAHNDFWNDVNGRLFHKKAPSGTSLADGPYAVFFSVSDNDDGDTFTEDIKEQYVQFSLFTGPDQDDLIDDMDVHLTVLFKDKTFTVTGWTVVIMRRVQGNGPIDVEADTETGEGAYTQMDVDYTILLSRI
jgi:hypothetical protein